MKIIHQVSTINLPFSLWTPLFFSYPPKAICFTWCIWCIKPHMLLPQLLLGPWMTHVLYDHWHFWALNVTCWKKARWPNKAMSKGEKIAYLKLPLISEQRSDVVRSNKYSRKGQVSLTQHPGDSPGSFSIPAAGMHSEDILIQLVPVVLNSRV